MTDAEYDAWEAAIKRTIDFWVPRMALTEWRRTVNYHRQGEPPAPPGYNPEGYCNPVQVVYDWRYKNVTFEVYVPVVAHVVGDIPKPLSDDDTLDEIIVHEMIHPHLGVLRRFVRDRYLDDHRDDEERIVVTFEMIIVALYREGLREHVRQTRRIARLEREITRMKAAAA